MRRWLPLAAALLAVHAEHASGQDLPCPEFLVNTYTTNSQIYPDVAAAPNGDFVVVWESYGQDGSSFGVFSQRFEASGAPRGPEFRVNTSTLGFQVDAAAAVDAQGNFVVVWGGPSVAIFGQRFDASGTPQGSEFQVNTYTTGVKRFPDVGAAAAGSFVVTWTSYRQDGDLSGIFGQRFDASGAAVGPEFRVNSSTIGSQMSAHVSVRPTGEFVVVWESVGASFNLSVVGQRFDASGAPAGGEFQVNTGTVWPQHHGPQVAHGRNGDFVVVWEANDGTSAWTAARHFDSSGAASAPEFRVNTALSRLQYQSRIAGASDEGYVVVWTGFEDGDGSSVHGRRLDAAGTPIGPAFRINAYTSSLQLYPAVAPAPQGGFVAAWESFGQDGSNSGIVASLDCARLYPVPPCRLADTRAAGPPLAANTDRSFPVSGLCGIPPDARAVAFNVTAVNPTDAGNLRLYPAGQPAPPTSVVNFATGRTRAGNTVMTLGTDRQIAVRCDMPAGSTGATHVVLDVFGYFKR